MSNPSHPHELTLQRLLTAAFGDRATPAFVPALLGAGLIHLLAILMVHFEPSRPEPIPDAALDVLILRAPGPVTAQPAPDATLSLQQQSGESPRGDSATTTAADRPPPNTEPAQAVHQVSEESRPETVTDQPATDPVAQSPFNQGQISPEPPAPAAEISLLDEPEVLAARIEHKPERRPAPDPLAARPAPADAARILASQGSEITRLTTSLETRASSHASRVRRKSISASTREFRYANYLGAWARKVERIGNLNYPQAAKEQKLYGSLILHVAVRSDGSVERIRVVRSSGLDLLDQAAIQIVELAAPYSSFPPDIAADTDVLDIIRTWQFMQGGVLGWER
jgi:protein TonB